jgi:hypothetical protein
MYLLVYIVLYVVFLLTVSIVNLMASESNYDYAPLCSTQMLIPSVHVFFFHTGSWHFIVIIVEVSSNWMSDCWHNGGDSKLKVTAV